MLIEVFKSKIHRVRVTESDLNYIGSITIDEDLLEPCSNQLFDLNVIVYRPMVEIRGPSAIFCGVMFFNNGIGFILPFGNVVADEGGSW